jgi:membrane-bound lytic murein transglycosylase D
MELAQAPTLSIQSKPTAVSWQHHRVKPGESLTTIARKYHTTVAALRKTNLMKNNVIQPHQTLLIPTANKAKVMSAAEARYAADKLPGPQQVIHTVSRWDSLANIARRYGVTPRQIQFWNNLHKDENVHTHQQLVLWLKHRYQPIITSRPSRYQVKRGDSLGAIAAKYHVNIKALQLANHLKGNAIRKGQWLSIPGTARPPVRRNASRLNKSYANHNQARTSTRALTHTVQRGQTLYSIARRYHVTPQQISQWNHLHGNVVKLGQHLVIHP